MIIIQNASIFGFSSILKQMLIDMYWIQVGITQNNHKHNYMIGRLVEAKNIVFSIMLYSK